MRLNLKPSFIQTIHFSTGLTLPKKIIDEVHRASAPDEDGDSLFYDIYNINRAKHFVWSWVIPEEEDKHEYSIKSNICICPKTPELEATIPSIDKLVEIISPLKDEQDFSCQITFEFSKRSKARSIIKLPLELIDLQGQPFDRIQGVHLVKYDGDSKLWDVAIDRESDGSLFERVMFNYSAPFSKSIAEEIMKKAIQISNSLVIQGS